MKEIEVTITATFSKKVKIRMPANFNTEDINLYNEIKRQHYNLEELLSRGKELACNAGRDDLMEAFDNWHCAESEVVEG